MVTLTLLATHDAIVSVPLPLPLPPPTAPPVTGPSHCPTLSALPTAPPPIPPSHCPSSHSPLPPPLPAVPPESLPDYVLAMCSSLGLTRESFYDGVVVESFVSEILFRYRDHPYHNKYHGLDVAHTMFAMLRHSPELGDLPKLDKFMLIMAAVAHDVNHMGVSNQFLIDSRDHLAVVYIDIAPQEAMHASVMFQVTQEIPGCNIFARMSPSTVRGHF